MKKSKKIILTLSAVTLTAGVLFTGIDHQTCRTARQTCEKRGKKT